MTRRAAPGPMLVLVAALAAAPAPLRAESAETAADLCDRAIANGARRGGVPVEVLQAISLTETGRNQNGRLRPFPWAINREGKGHWFEDQARALAFARESLAAGRTSFDVGCVQINYRWHGHAFPSLEAMFDPEWTATYAAQFLRTLYEARGDWSQAAGAYHSLTPDLAARYRARFDHMLADLAPGGALDPPDPAALPDIAAAPGAPRTGGPPATRFPLEPINPYFDALAAARRAARAATRAAGPAPGAGLLAAPSGPLLTEGRAFTPSAAPLLTAPPGPLH